MNLPIRIPPSLTRYLAALWMLAASTAMAASTVQAAPTANAAFPIIGYFPSWTGGSVNAIPFKNLTHINYSFVGANASGSITEPNAAMLTELVQEAHKKGVKVSVAIGGWNNGNTADFEKVASRPQLRARFVTHAMEMIEFYKLDGIDIDWEYPNASSAENYAALLKELGDALHKQGKLLSIAVVAWGDERGAFYRKEVFASIDFLNIMAYDWNWGETAKPHSSYGIADSALTYWLQRGCPKEKTILGVPFYGRHPEMIYKDIIGREPGAHNKDMVGTVQYNGIPTIRKKTELAFHRGGGIMIWEITQDTGDSTSLLSAIHESAVALQAAPPTVK
jgi:chitinase